MAQIARKLPSEVRPRIVNCDLGHSLFMDKGRIKFFCGSSEKALSGQEIVLSWLLSRKNIFLVSGQKARILVRFENTCKLARDQAFQFSGFPREVL